MAQHYNAADLVVSVPSSDSSPKSVYEAMFCKKPIVVSDLKWTYEILDERCIARVDARDSEKLSMAIIEIITHTSHAEKLADNALLVAHEHFDYKNNMIRMETIMTEAVWEKK